MWVWPQLVFGGSPPSRIVIGGPFPQAKPLPSPPSPSLFPPIPLGSFCRAPGGGGTGWWGGGVLGRKGLEGGGPPGGTWGQTHIWGYSNSAGVWKFHHKVPRLEFKACCLQKWRSRRFGEAMNAGPNATFFQSSVLRRVLRRRLVSALTGTGVLGRVLRKGGGGRHGRRGAKN